MGRIPDIELERLKQTVSLQRLAEARGITLKRHGADLLGLCPFHDDKTPSLVISPKKNLWHCLGACQTGGTVIDWVMKAEGISFRYAVELLQHDYEPSSLAAKKSSSPPKNSSIQRLPEALEHTAEDQTLLNQVIDYYHATLTQSPEALAYLKKRGLTSAAAIETFKLGFSNRTLGYRVPKASRQAGAELRGRLQKLGILRTSGHEHFHGSLVIPVLDETGNVQEVYGRKIRDDLRKGTAYHLYLPGPHRGVFNEQALAASKEIILCESLIDALTFWVNGYRNVTASYGIEGFTEDHVAAFKAHGTERVLIAYDRDAAGNTAAEKLSKKLLAEGIDCYRIQFPKGMDANAYACQVTPASKSLGVVIRSATWLGKGKPKPVMTTSLNGEPATAIVTQASTPVPAAPDVQPRAVEDTIFTALAAKDETSELAETAPPESSLPAAVIPHVPAPEIDTEVTDTEVVMTFTDRRYRVRGLSKNLSYDVLKVNVMVSKGAAVHVDRFDLYQSRPRASFIKQAALELGVSEAVIKTDIGRVLLKLEALQDAAIKATLMSQPATVAVADTERDAALALLTSPDLLHRIQSDFNRCGIVGEHTNSLVGYLACVSRLLDNPLAVLIQSTSAAGKSSLMEAVLKLIPEEEKIQYSAMTGQSLFYLGETDLKHKVLAIAEEEGASNAAYALKLLQSEGELTIASTGKDEASGDLVTKAYRVEGPVMLLMTTTAIEIDEELLNRCLVLTVNESREQTEAIHQVQRKKRTLDGLREKTERDALLTLHQNAQRLLQPLAVVNPYAEQLTFLSDRTRTRRDHEKYLTLIDSIALLHQHQREVKTLTQGEQTIRYVEVTLDDIEAANTLAHEVLGRTLDELPPQTRTLLRQLVTWVSDQCQAEGLVQQDYRFSRRDVRAETGWGNTQLRVHLARLVDMEYLLVHRGTRGQSYVYELRYDGDPDDHRAQLYGLIDVAALKTAGTTESSRGDPAGLAGSKRPQNGGQAGPVRPTQKRDHSSENKTLAPHTAEPAENAYLVRKNTGPSYPQTPPLAAREN